MKYGKETTKELVDFISCGMSNKSACSACNIGENTFYEWMKKGEFSKRIKEAHGEFKKLHLGRISKASENEKQWQASAWMLERCVPDEFAVSKVQIETNTGDISSESSEKEVAGLTNNDLLALLKDSNAVLGITNIKSKTIKRTSNKRNGKAELN